MMGVHHVASNASRPSLVQHLRASGARRCTQQACPSSHPQRRVGHSVPPSGCLPRRREGGSLTGTDCVSYENPHGPVLWICVAIRRRRHTAAGKQIYIGHSSTSITRLHLRHTKKDSAPKHEILYRMYKEVGLSAVSQSAHPACAFLGVLLSGHYHRHPTRSQLNQMLVLPRSRAVQLL